MTASKENIWYEIARRRYECGEYLTDFYAEYKVNQSYASQKSSKLKHLFTPKAKTCVRCRENKPLDDYHKRADGKFQCAPECRQCSKLRELKRRDNRLVYKKAYNNSPENLEARKAYRRKHYRENKKRINTARRAYNAHRRATKLQRTPSWSETEAIKKFYNKCPEGHHVDHIVPLQGEFVSGLHVLDNLQYLTAEENLSKGNKFDDST